MLPIDSVWIALAIVTFAAALQASIGFGFALVAAPLLVLLDRAYVPGPLLGLGFALGLVMAWRERGSIDRGGLRAAVAGRLLGVVPAGWVLTLATPRIFDLLFSALVLTGVALSMVHRRVTPTPRAVFGASVLSGLMGTITSIGGPPLALVYQNASGPMLRSTLALLFVMGSAISLATLAAIGRFGRVELVLTATLVPGVIAGVALSGPLLGRIDGSATRPLVLLLSAACALAVLGRALAGS